MDKTALIDLLYRSEVLQFGCFTLKSGRESPYFFNLGALNRGASLARVGEALAMLIQQKSLPFSVLFGPAYKGIPLVCSTAMALSARGVEAPYCFNRKVAKAYGDGGAYVGAPLVGDVLLLDDVITAGTTISETAQAMSRLANVRLSAIVTVLDRQERLGDSEHTAVQRVCRDWSIPIHSLIQVSDMMAYLRLHEFSSETLRAMERYQDQHCILS